MGSQESMNFLLWIIRGFQRRDRQDSQNLNNDSFRRIPVTSAQCIIGTDKNTENSILLIYDDDDYSQGYIQTKKHSEI